MIQTNSILKRSLCRACLLFYNASHKISRWAYKRMCLTTWEQERHRLVLSVPLLITADNVQLFISVCSKSAYPCNYADLFQSYLVANCQRHVFFMAPALLS